LKSDTTTFVFFAQYVGLWFNEQKVTDSKVAVLEKINKTNNMQLVQLHKYFKDHFRLHAPAKQGTIER